MKQDKLKKEMKSPQSKKRKRSRDDGMSPPPGSAKKKQKPSTKATVVKNTSTAKQNSQNKSQKVKSKQKRSRSTSNVDRSEWDNGTANVEVAEKKKKPKVKNLKQRRNVKPSRSDSDSPSCCTTKKRSNKASAAVPSSKAKGDTPNRRVKKKNTKQPSSGSESWDNGTNKDAAKRKRKRKRKRKKKQNGSGDNTVNGEQSQQKSQTDSSDHCDGPALSRICNVEKLSKKMEKKFGKSVDPRSKMMEKLNAGRFRYINEQLYSMTGEEALKSLGKDLDGFKVYHQGYIAQVHRWPSNPVDKIIKYIQRKPSSTVIADFGCGEAKIAQSVKNTVFSFDIVAMNKYVVVCDMAKVPLEAESVDLVVFCLSLMGTNLVDFITEANRVLRNDGILKIAEVASRFDNVKNFVRAFKRLGFTLQSKDLSNKFFYLFEFTKTGKAEKWNSLFGLELKPCVYKKR
ncbi:ribosomal RNA-processing protein 8-like [Glandiceps talaboti]